jgi:uncharacterized membrane protein (DUF373 family)
MFASTGALMLTASLAIIVPLVAGGHVDIDPNDKQPKIRHSHKRLTMALVGVRYVCMLALYVGAIGVIVSISLFKGKGSTLPISPTVQCVVHLCFQYFVIYLLLSLIITHSELSDDATPLHESRLFSTVDSAKAAVAFAPMLAILFVTTRMYALQLTNQKGAPQAWVQDAMYMATWSLFISVILCLATGLVTGTAADEESEAERIKREADRELAWAQGVEYHDAASVPKIKNKFVGGVLTAFRYLAMVLLYAGIVSIVVGLFVMTPESANGRGSIPVVTDVVKHTPVARPPPGMHS